jgi:hypothetical protein
MTNLLWKANSNLVENSRYEMPNLAVNWFSKNKSVFTTGIGLSLFIFQNPTGNTICGLAGIPLPKIMNTQNWFASQNNDNQIRHQLLWWAENWLFIWAKNTCLWRTPKITTTTELLTKSTLTTTISERFSQLTPSQVYFIRQQFGWEFLLFQKMPNLVEKGYN